MTCFTVGSTCAENLISPIPSARPLPGEPSQPRKKPSNCHSASRPRQPGITGSPLKWQGKNQRSGLSSSTARAKPLPYSPPTSAISEIRSNISIGGNGSCGPSTKSSPRPHLSRSSYSKLERRSVMPAPFQKALIVPHRFPNIRNPAGKVPALDSARRSVISTGERCCERVAKARQPRYNFICNDYKEARPAVSQQRTIVQSAVVPASGDRVAGTVRAELNGCPWH